MKKFFKGFLMFTLAIMVLCPFAFAGCSKNFTIKVERNNEFGTVSLAGTEAVTALGSNTKKKGENFKIAIQPTLGYTIAKIELDGTEVDMGNYEGGYYEYQVSAINKNHTIKVYFDLETFVIKFMCLDDATDQYVEYTPLRTYVKFKDGINLAQEKYSGPNSMIEWCTDEACENPIQELKPNRDWQLYCKIYKNSLASQLGSAQI